MAAMVKTVEYVEVSQSSTSSAINLTKGQDYTNCVPFMTLHGAQDYMDSHCTDVYFSGTTESGVINFQRNETRGVSIYIKCFVVEFDPAEVKVQQGSCTVPAAVSTVYSTPSSFTQSKSAINFYWQSTSATQAWDVHLVRYRLYDNGTQMEVYRNQAGGTVSGHYFIFEDISTNNDHFIVSQQTNTYSTTAGDAAIPSNQADPTKTFILGSIACSNGTIGSNSTQTSRIFMYFKSFVRCDRTTATSTIYYNVQFITFQDDTKVYVPRNHYTGFGTSATSLSNTWSISCNVPTSTVIATVPMGISRGTTTATTQIDSLWCSMKLYNSTQVDFQRNSTGGTQSSYYGYAIVDWAGITLNTGSNSTPIDPDLSPVKSVENFRISISNYQSERVLSKGQDASNCAIFASQRNSSGNAQIRESLHDVWIREPGLVVAHRTDGGGSGVVDVSVVEFYPDQVKVQMGVWINWGTTTTNTTIDAVSATNKAFVLAKWETNEATYWSRISIRVRFTDTSTVELYRNDGGNMIGGTFFVIEDLGDYFEVKHSVTNGVNTTRQSWNYGRDAYAQYYQCLPIASYAVSNDNYYVDRNSARVYQIGDGARVTMERKTATGTLYAAFQQVRFLDARDHTHPMAPSLNTSTTSYTHSLRDIMGDNRHLSVSLYNPMMMSVGRADTTGSDDMRGVFHTYRFINDNTEVESSREATVGVTLYLSYGGPIDWIGYTHPLADENHKLNYAYPTKSLVRSMEIFKSTGGRLQEFYLTKGQRPENCVPFGSWRVGANNGDMNRLCRHARIDINSRLTIESDASGDGGDLDQIWHVIEFNPDQVKVQHFYQLYTGLSQDVNIPQEVDLNKTMLWFTYSADTWNNQWQVVSVTGSFISSTQLNFKRNNENAAIYLTIYLIECLQDQWSASRVDTGSQSGTSVYDYTNFNHGVRGRFIQGSYSTANANLYCNQSCWRLYPRQDEGFQWNRQTDSGNIVDRHIEVVDFNPNLGIRVGGRWTDLSSGQTSETKGTVSGPLDLGRSMVCPTITNGINRTDGSGTDDVGSVCVKFELTDSSTITCTRYDKGITTYGWFQWVEWPAFKTHYFEGIVTERSIPIVRQVACFRADTNEMMDSTMSASGTGFYKLETTYSGSHYIVCQDDNPPIDYNHLVLGKMDPYPLPTFSGGEIIYG